MDDNETKAEAFAVAVVLIVVFGALAGTAIIWING